MCYLYISQFTKKTNIWNIENLHTVHSVPTTYCEYGSSMLVCYSKQSRNLLLL